LYSVKPYNAFARPRAAAFLLTVGASFFIGASATGCSTTEEQVSAQIDVLAGNDVGSERWNGAVDALTTIGRPGARQLVALLNPALYRGVAYRGFRDEIERTAAGAATVLGNIRHKAASASMGGLMTVAYRSSERLAALRALGELGFTDAAITALKVQLKDKAPLIRLLASVSLVKLGENSAQDTIINAVLHGGQELAETAIGELERANFHGVPTLVDLHRSGEHGARLSKALERVRDQLIDQLDDDDPEVRRASAAGLGDVADALAIEPLFSLLEDPSNLVRFYAASALVRLGDTRGGEFLFSALADADPILRLNAIKSLVRVQQSSGGVESRLLACLQHDNAALRSGAAQILGQAKVHTALDPLLSLIDDSDAQVRWNTAIALGHLGAAGSRDALEKLSDDGDETVAYYAQWALQQLGSG